MHRLTFLVTESSPPVTLTSTLPGCGQSGRRFANAPEHLAMFLASWMSTRISSSRPLLLSTTSGSRSTTRSSSPASKKRSRLGNGSRSAACGSSATETCPDLKPWFGSSFTARNSFVKTLTCKPRRRGCPTRLATRDLCLRLLDSRESLHF